jgi:Uma2 family endonuclease
MILGVKQKIYKMSLEYLEVPEIKEVIIYKNKRRKPTVMEYVKGAQELTERANDQIWSNLSEKLNQVISDYNPKYKHLATY